MTRSLICPLAALFAVASALSAAEEGFPALRLDSWHQWRGPLGTGVAPRGDPPIRWSEDKNVRWKVEVSGEGHASPIVWADRVFVLSAVQSERKAAAPPPSDPRRKTEAPRSFYRFVVTALDRATGATRWQRTACEELPHEGRQETNSYASGSPTTDGRRLYASFGSRGVYCYDLEGDLKWKRDFGDMRTRFGWGEGASPALFGDSLIVNWDQEDGSFITALNADTGEERWRVTREEATSWTTPLVVEHGGSAQVIVNGTERVRSYDLRTGKLLWQCGGQTVNPIPSPVALDGVVICMSGYRGSAAFAIPLDASGDVTGTDKVRWHLGRGTPYVPSPLLYESRVYFTRGNSGIVTSVDAKTGTVVTDGARLEELKTVYASPVAAAGRIYFVDREGTAVVIRHGDKLEVLATNHLDGSVSATPAIVGRQMFLRAGRHLYCLEEGAPGSGADARRPPRKGP